jgi:hypothetical protein
MIIKGETIGFAPVSNFISHRTIFLRILTMVKSQAQKEKPDFLISKLVYKMLYHNRLDYQVQQAWIKCHKPPKEEGSKKTTQLAHLLW